MRPTQTIFVGTTGASITNVSVFLSALGGLALIWVVYKLICANEDGGEKVEGAKGLRHAIALGYSDYDWMEQDPDLEALKTDPQFQSLLLQLRPQS